MLRIGHDILEIQRMRKAYARHGEALLHRILCEEERAYCLRFHDPVPRIAARFSVKESIAKALDTGIGSHLSWKDMEIYHTAQGAPKVSFSPFAIERFHHPQVEISISHCRLFVSTMAIWTCSFSSSESSSTN
ncbi:MAG: holo-[acyl-carrier-protein] synthase [Chlamydiae bacterium]|nr:holo-[acyl-carrier-protein] synthase [Chlamydiota bacterium]